ncbi:hypothetical protein Ancab_034229 [Ancistrocladus abbreviatus]
MEGCLDREDERSSPAAGEGPVATNDGGEAEMEEPWMCATDGAERGANGRVEMLDGVDGNGDAVREQEHAEDAEQAASHEEQDADEEPAALAGKPHNKDEKNVKRATSRPTSCVRECHSTYHLPPESEGDFSVSDLVWGKVKSHPWWPGQIFDPSDSSEKAMKYYRKDCYLVAYFGDRTFAWNEASQLKSFRTHFSQEEKQSSSETFQNAVNCALKEVSRRVEFGLACSCIQEKIYDRIKFQMVENAGIHQESSIREWVDKSTGMDSFQPDKLVGYIKALAQAPIAALDRLDVVIAKAQISAFYRLKGYPLPEFQFHGGLLECNGDISLFEDQRLSSGAEHADSLRIDDKLTSFGKGRSKGPHKRKHNLKDIVYQRRKEKSLSELMGESVFYLDGEYESDEKDSGLLISQTSARKRKASGHDNDDSMVQESTRTIALAKVSNSSSPRQSFKVGECIRRVASQLSGSPLILKSGVDGINNKHFRDEFDESLESLEDSPSGRMVIAEKKPSLDELLAKLLVTACEPMKGFNFFNDIIQFFSEFRNSVVPTRHSRKEASSVGKGGPGRKRKSSLSVIGSSKSFEFDDVNDSYWTDMVVEHSSEEKKARRGRKRKDHKLSTEDLEKSIQPSPRTHSRKQIYHEPVEDKPAEPEMKQEQLPTELILNFSEADSVPSEANLNKMFRRFGPLIEAETEVDRQTSRARVIFKRSSDAEVAYSSAAMFNIFGPMLVNYQLNYMPSMSFKSLPLALTQGSEDAA